MQICVYEELIRIRDMCVRSCEHMYVRASLRDPKIPMLETNLN